MFFVATAPSERRPRQLLAEGLDTFRVLDAAPGRVSRPDRQRRRDDRAPPRQRPHHADVRARSRATRGSRGSTARAPCTRSASPEFDELAAELPELPGRAGDHRRRGRPGHDVVRLRGAADGPRRRPRPAARLGAGQGRRRPRRLPGDEERGEHRRPARVSARELLVAGRARTASAWTSSASTCCCCRSAPTCRTSPATRRCRSNGSRCSCCRATGDARLVVPRLEAPRVDAAARPVRDRAVGRDRRPDRARRAARRLGRRHAPRSATRPGRASCSISSARCRRPTFVRASRRSSAPMRMVKDDDEIDGAARAAAHAVDAIAAEMRARPFAGRTELDVHRELVERMLARGHERSNFAIVAAGEHAASPHHEPSADRVDRRRRPRAVRLRRHDAAATAPTSRACSTSASRRPRCATSTRCSSDAQEAGVRAATVGTPCEEVDAAARRRDRRRRASATTSCTASATASASEAHEDPYMVAGQRRCRSRPATRSASSPASTSPGRFGMRLEDIVVATDDGPRRLNDAPRDLAVVG